MSAVIVMLEKRMFDFKYANNADIGLIKSNQQVQQNRRTMSEHLLFNEIAHQSNCNGQHFVPVTMKRKYIDRLIMYGPRNDLFGVCASNHSKLYCNAHYIKTHRSDLSADKQPCNLFSTKLTNEHRTIATVHGRVCERKMDNTITNANSTTPTTVTTTKTTAVVATATTNDGQMNSMPSKASLKYVYRSPLTVIHRANLLKIFIKYLLILNCFVCIASGNLMSRNVGNDLSSKHNQTNVEMTTSTTTHESPLVGGSGGGVGGGRKGMLTTASPLLLHSIMSSNRSHFHNNAQPAQNPDANTRSKHHMHQHPIQDATFVSDDASHKMPNADNEHSGEFTRCTSCQFREQLKAQNLASIKMHILARLSMTHPPNITGRPHISEQILDQFYQSNDFRYIRIRNGTDELSSAQNEDDDDDLNEMQGDDPTVVTNNKHQHHHLHEYNRNGGGGIKTGLHEQHHHHQAQHHHYNRHPSRLENEFNEEYDYSDRGGIVYNMDYFDESRSSSRLHYDDIPYENVEESDEAFYSTTDVIYSFPKLSKARHRGDILEFTIKNNNHLSVSGAIFNMFVHGEDWLAENDPNLWNLRVNGGKSGGGMHHADESNVSGTSTISAAAAATGRDEYSLTTSSDSFHKLHDNGKNVNNNHLSISINRFVHRHQQQQSTNDQEQSKKSAQPTQQQQQQPQQPQQQQQQQQRYTRIDSNFVGEIPKGAGEWIQFNITLMVSEWIQQQQQKHQSVNAQSSDIVQEVVIKTLEPWMRQLLVLDTNSKNRPYIEIQTRDMRKHRTKRHLAKDCRENERQSRCCRYPLRVDFRKFGWDWIIAPDIYEAYYCAGECPIGFLPKHPHTYIYSLSSSFSTCCSPRKLSPLSLLYFDDNKNVIHSIIPNMAVDKCGCS